MVAGFKNSGKTTLITCLIRDLTRYGFKIAVFKHIYHSDFKVDYEGKDTWRYIEAGANASIAVSKGRLYINEYLDEYPDLNELIERYRASYDIVILEGFEGILGSRNDIYKIIIGRDERDLNTISSKLSEPILGMIQVEDINKIKCMEDYHNILNKILNILRR